MTKDLMLELGRERGGSAGDSVQLPARALLRHMMALGSSGSGKTVLSKVVVEEIVRAGIPALCLDPQGDLCSLALAAEDPDALAERGVDPEVARAFAERCEVVIFTPASDKGVALGADPLAAIVASHPDLSQVDEDLWTRAAGTVAALLGYAPDDDDGEGFIAVLDTVLRSRLEAGAPLTSLRALADHLGALDDGQLKPYARFWQLKPLRQAIRKLARLEVGPRRRLFHAGVPLDIDLLMGRGIEGPAATAPGKIRVAVVHLNSLHQQEDKEFLVAAIAERLYAWMLAQPSADPQLLFYLDEIAPYMPPVRKPQCKDSLQLLFKQARKYGVCCLMATQNPGDVDYRAMAQFGTWALGRLMTRQDLKKVEPTVKALAPVECDAVMAELPRLEPGQFVLLSPDHFDAPTGLQTRWLYTEHQTLDEARIEELSDARWRSRFAALTKRKAAKPKREAEPAKAETSTELQAAEPEPEPPPTPRRTKPGKAKAEQEPVKAEPAKAEPVKAEPAKAEPAKAEPVKAEPVKAEPAKAEPAKPNKPSKAELAAQAREAQLAALREHGPVDVKRFAELLDCSETKARRALKLLREAGLVGDFKRGRSAHYWALDTGARPDLDMPEQVLVATPKIGKDQVSVLAQGYLRASMFGLGRPAETLMNVSLVHELLWRVDFEERIAAGLLGRLVGGGGEQRIGSVYLHPRTLEVLSWQSGRGLRFGDKPAEHASDVHDLDGLVRFVRLAPAGLRFDEQAWAARASEAQVAAALRARWSLDIKSISPCFLPLWKLMIRRLEPAGMRVVMLDSIEGSEYLPGTERPA